MPTTIACERGASDDRVTVTVDLTQSTRRGVVVEICIDPDKKGVADVADVAGVADVADVADVTVSVQVSSKSRLT